MTRTIESSYLTCVLQKPRLEQGPLEIIEKLFIFMKEPDLQLFVLYISGIL